MKNTVLDLGLEPSEGIIDLPGAVYVFEEDKTLSTVGNTGRNVDCQDKIKILPGCIRLCAKFLEKI